MMHLDKDRYSSYRHWIILAVIYFCFLISAVIFQSVPPILSLILDELNFSHAQGGLLMSFFALPGIIISIPVGLLTDRYRYGQKIIGIVSLLLMSAGAAIFASGNSIAILTLARTVSGIGAMILLVISPQMVSQWFSGKQLGIAMGIFTTAMPVGVIISMNLLSFIGELMGWRATMWIIAGFPILALPLFILLYVPKPNAGMQNVPLAKNPFMGIFKVGLPIWLLGMTWMFFNAAFISLFTFTPDLLNNAGYRLAFAGFLTGVVMLPQLPLNPLVGYMMERLGRKPVLISVGGLALAVIVVLIPWALNWIFVFMLLIGILTSLIPPPVYALPGEVVSQDQLGLSYGILSTSQNLGVLFGPFTVGFMVDIYSSYKVGYGIISIFAVLVIISIGIFNRIQKNTNPEQRRYASLQ